MASIHLTPEGKLLYNKNIVTTDPLTYLGYALRLDPAVTLRSFFALMEAYPDLLRLNPFQKVFQAQYRQCPATGCTLDAIDHLALARTVEMTGYPGPPGMQLYISLEGHKEKKRCPIKSYWLENLLDLPLQLGRLNHRVFGDKVDTFTFDTVFNLFEFIDGICWQLSFHNLPAECRVVL